MSDHGIAGPERSEELPRPAAADPSPDGFDEDAPLRPPRKPGSRAGLSRALKFAGLGALAVGLIVGVYVSGQGTQAASGGTAGTTPVATASATPTLDAAQVATLKAKIAANPSDTVSLKALADLYAAVEQWADAISWQAKVVELAPTDVDNRLILGVYQFNASDLDNAEKNWLEVLRQQPKQVEAYFDLGFLYMAKSPPEMEKTQQMWLKVVEIDPTSDLAATVESHLSALAGASASASPTATAGASTAPSATAPAASPNR